MHVFFRCRPFFRHVLAVTILTASIIGSADAGFNPFKAIGDVVSGVWDAGKSVVREVGSFLGAGPGGFIGAATAPMIGQAEAAGHRIVDDADKRFAERLKDVDHIAGKQIGNLDARLEARITQADDAAKARIAQVDEAMKQRIIQIDGVLGSAIADVDQVLETRIDQLDEVAGKRLGNLDVIATKASFTFEAAVTRLIGIACLMVFIAAVVWRAYTEMLKSPADLNAKWYVQLSTMIRRSWKRVVAQTLIAGCALGGLYLLFVSLPGSSIDRTQALAKMHESSLERSLVALDLRQARFHAAQLQIIDPISTKYRALALKTELLRDVFTRPTLLQSLSGLNDVVRQIEQIEVLLPTVASDPDVETIKAIVHWRMGPTKAHEYLAAQLCTEALGHSKNGKFVLKNEYTFAMRGLAIDCLRNYLSQPIAAGVFDKIKSEERRVTLAQMHELVAELDSGVTAENSLKQFSYTPLSYVMKYNSLVRELSKRSTMKYFQLLEAQRQVHKAIAAQIEADASANADSNNTNKQTVAASAKIAKELAIEGRKNVAKELLAVWDSFEESLKTDQSIRGTSAPLAALLLNDAVHARALVYATDITDQVAPLVGELTDAQVRRR